MPYLLSLKKEGVLYIDTDCFDTLLFGGQVPTDPVARKKLFGPEPLSQSMSHLTNLFYQKSGIFFHLEFVDITLGGLQPNGKLYIMMPPQKEKKCHFTQTKNAIAIQRKS
jgi:hypothetical protein